MISDLFAEFIREKAIYRQSLGTNAGGRFIDMWRCHQSWACCRQALQRSGGTGLKESIHISSITIITLSFQRLLLRLFWHTYS